MEGTSATYLHFSPGSNGQLSLSGYQRADADAFLDRDIFANISENMSQELAHLDSQGVNVQQFNTQEDSLDLRRQKLCKLLSAWLETSKRSQQRTTTAVNLPLQHGILDTGDQGNAESRLLLAPRTASQLSHNSLIGVGELGDGGNPDPRTSPPVTEAPATSRAWILGASSSTEVGRVSPNAKSNSPGATKTKSAKSDRLPSPELSPFRGDYDFYTEPPEDEVVSGRNISRSAHWTYDSSQRTLFIKPARMFPLRVHLGRDLPRGAFFHVMFAFEEPEHCFEPVVRCANHREQYAKSAFGRFDSHFGLADNATAAHQVDAKGHPIIVIPYAEKSQGVHTDFFQFTCFSSSCMPFKKKTLKMINSLYIDGQVYGRDILYLRVCACPGRDRISVNNKQVIAGEGERRKRAHSEVDVHDDTTPYNIKRTVHGWKNYMLVQKMIDNMESLENMDSPGRNEGSPTSATSSDD